jgi:hypothetical protein
MPRLSVRLVRTALFCLVLGAALGGILLAAPAAGGVGWWRAHAELMLAGWVLQLAIGVAYWILPKHAAGPPRGSEMLAAWIHPLLNAGVGISVIACLALLPAAVLAAGRTLELSAVAAFAMVAWPRVKPFGIGREPGTGDSER